MKEDVEEDEEEEEGEAEEEGEEIKPEIPIRATCFHGGSKHRYDSRREKFFFFFRTTSNSSGKTLRDTYFSLRHDRPQKKTVSIANNAFLDISRFGKSFPLFVVVGLGR